VVLADLALPLPLPLASEPPAVFRARCRSDDGSVAAAVAAEIGVGAPSQDMNWTFGGRRRASWFSLVLTVTLVCAFVHCWCVCMYRFGY
jgi:hypothetical protein